MATLLIGNEEVTTCSDLLYHVWDKDDVPDWQLELDNPGWRVISVTRYGYRYLCRRDTQFHLTTPAENKPLDAAAVYWCGGRWIMGAELASARAEQAERRRELSESRRRAAEKRKRHGGSVIELREFVLANARVPRRFLSFGARTYDHFKEIGLTNLLMIVVPEKADELKAVWNKITW